MNAADILTALKINREWINQAALIAKPSKFGQPYQTTQAAFYPETTVRIPATKKAKRTGKTYETLQRRRLDLAALVHINKFSYQPIVIGVEIKISVSDLMNDSKIADYLPYCHLFFLAVPEHIEARAKEKLKYINGVGLISFLSKDKYSTPIRPKPLNPDPLHLGQIYAEMLIHQFKREDN